jgi:anti-anti-sigma regulatory factor
MRQIRANPARLFVQNTHTKILIDFGGFKVFDSATVDTNILILQLSDTTSRHQYGLHDSARFSQRRQHRRILSWPVAFPCLRKVAVAGIISDDAAQKLKANLTHWHSPSKIGMYPLLWDKKRDSLMLSSSPEPKRLN